MSGAGLQQLLLYRPGEPSGELFDRPAALEDESAVEGRVVEDEHDVGRGLLVQAAAEPALARRLAHEVSSACAALRIERAPELCNLAVDPRSRADRVVQPRHTAADLHTDLCVASRGAVWARVREPFARRWPIVHCEGVVVTRN